MGNKIEEQILSTAREQQLTEDATRRASAMPLPSVLSDAFLADAIKVTDGVFVRRVVASDWKILQGLDSPIYKMILEVQKDSAIREDVTYTDEEEWEMCWQFTHSPKEVRELFVKGRDAFRATAMEEMGDKYPLDVTKLIVDAVSKQIVKSFETSIKYGAEEDKKK